MLLIIDGYNLLNAVGIVGGGVGPHTLQRARMALLNFLAESLAPETLPQTTVVFDAATAPPGLPRAVQHRGIHVRFSTGYQDADELIEELIRDESAPRRLTVVSSDHRLHRAARCGCAAAVDSDVWYADVLRRRRIHDETVGNRKSAKPPVPLGPGDVQRWLDRFGGEKALAEWLAQETASEITPVEGDAASDRSSPTHPDKPTDDEAAGFGDPFPPGYAEDLLEDEEDW